MRVCFFADTFLPLVGAEMVLHNLATRVAAEADRAVVFAPRVRGLDNRIDAPYRVVRYAKPRSKRFGVRKLLLPLAMLQLRHRFEILHCHATYPPAWVGRTFRRVFPMPMVVRPHGSDILPGERIRGNPRLEERVRRSLLDADAVIAQGDFLRDVIRDLGVDESRIHIIHNGVSLEEFASGGDFGHPRPYVLGIGNLSHRKGFDVLLRAYARLESPPADVVIAGDGSERPTLEALAGDLGIAARVRFAGALSGQRKVDAYRCARFLVVPSRSEPFANVILEGLAAGLPVIASAVGGNTQLVVDGSHGALFPSEDDGALAATLRVFLDRPEHVARLREAVPAFVAPHDWKRIASRYLELYRELIDRHAARRRATRAGSRRSAPRRLTAGR